MGLGSFRMESRSEPSSSMERSVPGSMTWGVSVSIAFSSPGGGLGGGARAAGLCFSSPSPPLGGGVGGDTFCCVSACTSLGLGAGASSPLFCGGIGFARRMGSPLLSAISFAI